MRKSLFEGRSRLPPQAKRQLVIVAERSWPERAEANELRMRFAVLAWRNSKSLVDITYNDSQLNDLKSFRL